MAQHEAGNPHMILYQFINVAIIFLALVYFLKDKATAFFRARREGYIAASRRTDAIVQTVQKQKYELQSKLRELDQEEQEVLDRAEIEAKKKFQEMMEETDHQRHRLQREHDSYVHAELVKAKESLRRQLIENVFENLHSSGEKKELQS